MKPFARPVLRPVRFSTDRGSLMLEAIALLGLMTLMSPMLVKQTSEKTQEVEEVTVAGQMKMLRDAAMSYIDANLGDLNDTGASSFFGAGYDASTNSQQMAKLINNNDLAKFLPAGFCITDGDNCYFQNRLVQNYRASVVRQHSCDLRDSSGNRVPECKSFDYTVLISSGPKNPGETADPIADKRAMRIASMVGADGGFIPSSKMNTAMGGSGSETVVGAQGIWEIPNVDVFFPAGEGSWQPGEGQVVVSTVYKGNATLGEYLYRKQTAVEGGNAMFTDLDMAGTTGLPNDMDGAVRSKSVAGAPHNIKGIKGLFMDSTGGLFIRDLARSTSLNSTQWASLSAQEKENLAVRAKLTANSFAVGPAPLNGAYQHTIRHNVNSSDGMLAEAVGSTQIMHRDNRDAAMGSGAVNSYFSILAETSFKAGEAKKATEEGALLAYKNDGSLDLSVNSAFDSHTPMLDIASKTRYDDTFSSTYTTTQMRMRPEMSRTLEEPASEEDVVPVSDYQIARYTVNSSAATNSGYLSGLRMQGYSKIPNEFLNASTTYNTSPLKSFTILDDAPSLALESGERTFSGNSYNLASPYTFDETMGRLTFDSVGSYMPRTYLGSDYIYEEFDNSQWNRTTTRAYADFSPFYGRDNYNHEDSNGPWPRARVGAEDAYRDLKAGTSDKTFSGMDSVITLSDSLNTGVKAVGNEYLRLSPQARGFVGAYHRADDRNEDNNVVNSPWWGNGLDNYAGMDYSLDRNQRNTATNSYSTYAYTRMRTYRGSDSLSTATIETRTGPTRSAEGRVIWDDTINTNRQSRDLIMNPSFESADYWTTSMVGDPQNVFSTGQDEGAVYLKTNAANVGFSGIALEHPAYGNSSLLSASAARIKTERKRQLSSDHLDRSRTELDMYSLNDNSNVRLKSETFFNYTDNQGSSSNYYGSGRPTAYYSMANSYAVSDVQMRTLSYNSSVLNSYSGGIGSEIEDTYPNIVETRARVASYFAENSRFRSNYEQYANDENGNIMPFNGSMSSSESNGGRQNEAEGSLETSNFTNVLREAGLSGEGQTGRFSPFMARARLSAVSSSQGALNSFNARYGESYNSSRVYDVAELKLNNFGQAATGGALFGSSLRLQAVTLSPGTSRVREGGTLDMYTTADDALNSAEPRELVTVLRSSREANASDGLSDGVNVWDDRRKTTVSRDNVTSVSEQAKIEMRTGGSNTIGQGEAWTTVESSVNQSKSKAYGQFIATKGYGQINLIAQHDRNNGSGNTVAKINYGAEENRAFLRFIAHLPTHPTGLRPTVSAVQDTTTSLAGIYTAPNGVDNADFQLATQAFGDSRSGFYVGSNSADESSLFGHVPFSSYSFNSYSTSSATKKIFRPKTAIQGGTVIREGGQQIAEISAVSGPDDDAPNYGRLLLYGVGTTGIDLNPLEMTIRDGFIAVSNSFVTVNGAQYNPATGQYERVSGLGISENFRLDPAYVSVMNDIKLTSRGGAKLSQLLPDYILKASYFANNTFALGPWPCDEPVTGNDNSYSVNNTASTISYSGGSLNVSTQRNCSFYVPKGRLASGRAGSFSSTSERVSFMSADKTDCAWMNMRAINAEINASGYLDKSNNAYNYCYAVGSSGYEGYGLVVNYYAPKYHSCDERDNPQGACLTHPFLGVIAAPGMKISVETGAGTNADAGVSADERHVLPCPSGYEAMLEIAPSQFDVGQVIFIDTKGGQPGGQSSTLPQEDFSSLPMNVMPNTTALWQSANTDATVKWTQAYSRRFVNFGHEDYKNSVPFIYQPSTAIRVATKELCRADSNACNNGQAFTAAEIAGMAEGCSQAGQTLCGWAVAMGTATPATQSKFSYSTEAGSTYFWNMGGVLYDSMRANIQVYCSPSGQYPVLPNMEITDGRVTSMNNPAL